MLKISIQKLPGKTLTFVSLQHAIAHAVEARRVTLPSMSGYPVGAHVIGRLQNAFNLNSVTELLESIQHLKKLAKLASEVMLNITIAKIDRFQLVKTDIEAYVNKAASEFGYPGLTEEDVEFVALMIVASESLESAWILDMPSDPRSNRVIRFQTLRESVLRASLAPVLGDVPVYEPISDSIVTLSSTPTVVKIKDKDVRAETINNQGRIHCLAHLRLIDHVDALLNSTEIWNFFLSPRKSGDPGENEERGKSLKIFSAYLHSLVTMPQMFAIQLFYESVGQLSSVLSASLIVPDHVMRIYNDVVLSNDVLGVSGDVNKVKALVAPRKVMAMDTELEAMYTEAIGITALNKDIDDLVAKATSATFPLNFTDWKLLDDAAKNPFLSAAPISVFNLTLTVDDALLIQDLMMHRITEAATSVIPGLGRYITPDLSKKLKDLNLHIQGGIGYGIPLSPDPLAYNTSDVISGSFSRYAAGISKVYDSKLSIRRDYYLNTVNGSKLVKEFQPVAILHRDAASVLRGLTETQWKGLYPSWLVDGENYYTTSSISNGVDVRERLLEMMTGTHLEMFKRTVGNLFARQMYATFFSSFALLYVVPAEVEKLMSAEDFKPDSSALSALKESLVTGYGNPYGTTYETLALKQGEFKKEDLVRIAPGCYLRIHKMIPIPVNVPAIEPDFYLQHPQYYYSSNSVLKPVTKWLMDDGLLQFGLIPIEEGSVSSIPSYITDRRYGYLNDALFAQMDVAYRGPSGTSPLPAVNVKPLVHEWAGTRFKNFLTYTRMVTYGSEAANKISTNAQSEDDITRMIKQSEAELLKIESAAAPAKQSPNDLGKLKDATSQFSAKSRNEKKKGAKKEHPRKGNESGSGPSLKGDGDSVEAILKKDIDKEIEG